MLKLEDICVYIGFGCCQYSFKLVSYPPELVVTLRRQMAAYLLLTLRENTTYHSLLLLRLLLIPIYHLLHLHQAHLHLLHLHLILFPFHLCSSLIFRFHCLYLCLPLYSNKIDLPGVIQCDHHVWNLLTCIDRNSLFSLHPDYIYAWKGGGGIYISSLS